MIPLRLRLKNFLCYRDNVPTLDLEGFRLVCLCGENGHGKSALLDAITWVLWGEARGKSQDDLVHQGAGEMEVELEFEVSGQRYRVLRKHSRSTSRQAGTTLLELQVASDGGFRSISANTVRATEAKIRSLLRMDYETFVHSTYLLQGRADLFTTSTPARRKEVLAEILGLSNYEALVEAAKARAREKDEALHLVEGEISMLTRELAYKPQWEQELQEARRSLAALIPQLESLSSEREKLSRTVEALHASRKALEELRSRLRRNEEEVGHLSSQAEALKKRVQGFKQVLERSEEIRVGFARLEEARKALEELERKRKEFYRLEKGKNELEKAVIAERERLLAEERRLHSLQQELEPKARLLEFRQQALSREEQRLAQLDQSYQELTRARDRAQELEQKKGHLERVIAVEEERLAGEIRQLRLKVSQELEPRARRLPSLEQQRAQVEAEMEKIEQQRREMEQRRERLQHLVLQMEQHRAQKGQLQRELKELRSKVELLSQGDARCPLCGTPLTPGRCEHLAQEMEEQEREKRRLLQEEEAHLRRLEHEQLRLSGEIEVREREVLRAQREAQVLSTRLAQEWEEAQRAQEELAQIEQEIRRKEEQQRSQDFAKEERHQWLRIQGELETLGYDPQRHQALTRELQQCQAQVTQLQRDVAESQKARGDLELTREKLQQVQDLLRQEAFALKEQAQLREIQHQLATLDYDPALHEEIQHKVKELEPLAEEYRRLKEAEASLPHDTAALEGLEAILRSREQELREGREKESQLERELESLPMAEQELKEAEERLRRFQERQMELQARVRSLEERLQHLARLEKEQEAKERERALLEEERGIYEELVRVFGKNGIQALMIESALPELEAEANLLLGRLTDNRMHLKLETQRERKGHKGEPIETLDIKISDELGTRSYEMFSGGEGFRVNFALRIALARLVARRAGAPLPVLFIDEGFGTQDAAGRERLLEAIQSIQDDFQKIIVVTHVEELKEAFPTRIEVIKTEAGSAFRVVE